MGAFIRKGVHLLEEQEGNGAEVRRQHYYVLAIRISLNRGEIINRPQHCLSYRMNDKLQKQEDGFLHHCVRIDRESLIAGVFYAVVDMRVGGYRRVEIAPHLAYGEKGIDGIIPPNAKLTVEIKVLEEMEQG